MSFKKYLFLILLFFSCGSSLFAIEADHLRISLDSPVTKSESFSFEVTTWKGDEQTNEDLEVEFAFSEEDVEVIGGDFIKKGSQEFHTTFNTADSGHWIKVWGKYHPSIEGSVSFDVVRYVDKFEIDDIDAQDAGEFFEITVSARDELGALAQTFNDEINISCETGEISPTSLNRFGDKFTDGVATFDVTLYGGDPGDYENKINLTNTRPYEENDRAQGQSNNFMVNPGSYKELVLLLPGEELFPAQNSGEAKLGTPDFTRAGDLISGVEVIATDQYYNPVDSGPYPEIAFTSDDPHVDVHLPSVTAMTDNKIIFDNIKLCTARTQAHVKVEDAADGVDIANSSWIEVLHRSLAEFDVVRKSPEDPSTVNPFGIDVTALDMYGNVVENYVNDVILECDYWKEQYTMPSQAKFEAGKLEDFDVQITRPVVETHLKVKDGSVIGESDKFRVYAGGYSKLITILPGQRYEPGTEAGVSGTAHDIFAGETTTVTVRATDAMHNPKDGINEGIDFKFLNSEYNVLKNGEENLSLGQQEYYVQFRTYDNQRFEVKGSHTSPENTIYVKPGDYEKLVLLGPGQSIDPGADPVLSNGKKGSLDPWNAGEEYNLGVAATDKYWNPIKDSNFYPTISFSYDTGEFSLPEGDIRMTAGEVYNNKASGTELGGHKLRVHDTESSREAEVNIEVIAGSVDHYVVEIDNPGVNKIVGDAGFNIRVEARDKFGNINEDFNGSADLYVIEGDHTFTDAVYSPSEINFANGVWDGKFRSDRAGEDVVVKCIDGAGRQGESDQFTIEPEEYDDLVLLLPGQSHTPGIAPGKKFDSTPAQAGEVLDARVLAVDKFYNQTSKGGQPKVELTSDGYAIFDPKERDVSPTGEAEFFTRFTEATSHEVRAEDVNFGAISDTSTIEISPGPYEKLQILLPGETADPGSLTRTETGKSGSPVTQTAGISFNVEARAVDEFWNKTTLGSGDGTGKIRLNSEEEIGNLNNDRPFENGSVLFEDIYLPEGESIDLTVSDGDDSEIYPQTGTLKVEQGNYYVIDTPAEPIAGEPFEMVITQYDYKTDEIADANHEIYLEAFNVGEGFDDDDLQGDITRKEALLSDGTVTIADQEYEFVEDIKIKVTDSHRREKTSETINMQPLGLEYVASVPDSEVRVGPPNKFDMSIKLRETKNNNLVRTMDEEANPISLSYYSIDTEDDPVLGEGAEESVKFVYLVDGEASFESSYTKAEDIRILMTGNEGSSNQADPIKFISDGYKKIQILAPGEEAVPGVDSETGKTGTPDTQSPGSPFYLEVRAVDQYWNVEKSFGEGNIELENNTGELNVPDGERDFNQGRKVFNVSLINPLEQDQVIEVTAKDGNDIGKQPQSSEIPVSGSYYEITSPEYAVSGDGFEFKVKLCHVDGSTMTDVSHDLYFTALNRSYESASGELNRDEGWLSGGIFSYNKLNYNRSEDIIIKVEDIYGREVHSDVIKVRADPSALFIDGFLSEETLEAGKPFYVDLELRDKNTNNSLVENMDRQLKVIAYPEKWGEPSYEDAVLKNSVYTDKGKARASFSGYETAENINIKYWDAEDSSKSRYIQNITVEPGPANKIELSHKSDAEPGEAISVVAFPFDRNENRLLNEKVSFSVVQGDAEFESSEVYTDEAGRAEAVMNVGLEASGSVRIEIRCGEVSRSRIISVYPIPEMVFSDDRDVMVVRDEDIFAKPDTLIKLEFAEEIGFGASREIYYSIDGGEEKLYTEPFSMEEIGKYSIDYYSEITSVETGITHVRSYSKAVYITNTLDSELVNYPNPFRAGEDETFIEYTLLEDSNVTVEIYNLLGEPVWKREFVAREKGGRAGVNIVRWDGRNNNSKVVGNGGYICRVYAHSEGNEMIRKIAVVK